MDAELRAETRAAARSDGLQRQGFRIGRHAFATGFDATSELVDMGTFAPVPHAPQWLLGLANLHGHPIPVFDLAGPLATERDPLALPMVLVFGRGDAIAGVVIDGFPLRLRFSAGDVVSLDEVPPELAAHATGAFRDPDGETLWIDFDTPSFLDGLTAADAASHKN